MPQTLFHDRYTFILTFLVLIVSITGWQLLLMHTTTRIGVFAQGQILCISPNGLQADHCDPPPPPPILDDRKRISTAFLAISDQYATLIYFICFHKMAAGGQFGWPKITFDHICRHFRSIRNFSFFWICSQNGCRRPFWMTENHFWSHFSPFQINMQLWYFFSQNGCQRPLWMTENHFWSHFPPFQINTQLRFLNGRQRPQNGRKLEVRFSPKTIGFFHYVLSMAMPNMKLIGEFMTQCRDATNILSIFYTVFPIDAKVNTGDVIVCYCHRTIEQ